MYKVEQLLSQGAKVDSRRREQGGMTPLHLAAQQGHAYVVEVLLDNDADVNILDWDMKLPVAYAIEGDHIETVKVFVDRRNKVPFKQFSFSEVKVTIHFNVRAELLEYHCRWNQPNISLPTVFPWRPSLAP